LAVQVFWLRGQFARAGGGSRRLGLDAWHLTEIEDELCIRSLPKVGHDVEDGLGYTHRRAALLASDVDVQQASLCVVINQPVGNPKRKV
jgi:hypothetical protein